MLAGLQIHIAPLCRLQKSKRSEDGTLFFEIEPIYST